jgi:hypothetical protein
MKTMWVPIAGKWKFDGDTVVYLGPDSEPSPYPYGIVLSKERVREHSVAV